MRRFLVPLLALTFGLFSTPILLPAQSSRTYILHGSVVNAQGEPVASALVQLSDFAGAMLGSELTDGMGEFTFVVNSPGPYQANVMTPFGTEQLSVPDGAFQNITLRLHSMPPHPGAAAGSTISLNDLEAPRQAKSEFAKAKKDLKKSDLSDAWRLVNSAIRNAPDWGKAYMLRGVLSLTFHNYDSARSDFSTAIARDPKNSMALTFLGKLYNTTGHLRLSRVYLQRALQLPPVSWPTYLEMAELDLKQHDYAGASRMTSLSMRCRPAPPPSVHYLAALAAYGLHDYARSGKEFSLYLAQAPKTPATAKARATARRNLLALARLQPIH